MSERILKLEQGRALIVSDLQGNRRDFDRCLTVFSELQKRHECDYLIFCGDVIHGYADYPDESLEIIDTIIELRRLNRKIILLMGNHELSHVMHWKLSRGLQTFTESFERKIKENRKIYWQFFHDLPFAIISAGGLFINHTGPSAALSGIKSEYWDLFWKKHEPHCWYKNLDIEKSFQINQSQKAQWDPSFAKKSLLNPEGKVLWEAFMNKNELDYASIYETLLEGFTKTMSKIAPTNLIISGHIQEEIGYRIVHEKHFRLCSSYGARNVSSKQLLLVTLKETYKHAEQLKSGLINLW